jgi:acyl-[acyl-carrier-protein]-phospholipid O-acyltransferase/long-chain-fatty-acid--[acyl-carrier-protein] ligase
MVPHGTVEQKIVEVFGWESVDAPAVFVAGVPDAAKGEALVLLSTRDVTPDVLRTRLAEVGVPNLWVPRIIKRVDKIPMLGTGKTDLKRCKELALESVR